MIPARALLFSLAALFALSSGAALADDYTATPLTASQILSRARLALGEYEPGSYVSLGYSGSGGTEVSISTRTRGDDSITSFNHGIFATAYGTYLGVQWVRDENGFVRVSNTFRSRENPNTNALAHPDDPQYNVRVLGLTQSQPQEYAVEIDPANGDDQYRYYDATTFFLDRVVDFAKDRYRHVTTYSDYRKAFGKIVPYRVQYSDGRPQNDTLTELLSITRSADMTPIAMPTSRPLFTLPLGGPVQIPAHFTPDGIVVRVVVAGQGLDFLLDSGAAGLFIDPGVARKLGLILSGRHTVTIGGDVDDSFTYVPAMTIGPLQMHNIAFNASPIDFETGDSKVVGLLGCDFFANSVLGIDFQKETVTLYPKATFDPAAQGLQQLPVDLDDCVPRAKASFENIEGSFGIDTGATISMAYQNYVSRLPSAQALGPKAQIAAVGGTVLSKVTTLHDLLLGGIQFKNVTVLVPTTSTFDFAQYDGIIGRDVLHYYELFFDYRNQSIYLKKSP